MPQNHELSIPGNPISRAELRLNLIRLWVTMPVHVSVTGRGGIIMSALSTALDQLNHLLVRFKIPCQHSNLKHTPNSKLDLTLELSSLHQKIHCPCADMDSIISYHISCPRCRAWYRGISWQWLQWWSWFWPGHLFALCLSSRCLISTTNNNISKLNFISQACKLLKSFNRTEKSAIPPFCTIVTWINSFNKAQRKKRYLVDHLDGFGVYFSGQINTCCPDETKMV